MENSIIKIRVDDCVSCELETIQLVKALIDDVSLSKEIQIVKSAYHFARLDFLMYNKQNLRCIGIECKSFKDEPCELAILKIKNLFKFYDLKIIYAIKHLDNLLWVNLNDIDFDKVEIVDRFCYCNEKKEYLPEKRYALKDHMSSDMDALSTYLTLAMIS